MAIPANIRYIPPSERDSGLLNSLTALWEASVRATHHFLREADIENLKPYVTEWTGRHQTSLCGRRCRYPDSLYRHTG